MLQELCITNLALIEELRINFGHGLVVLTGETGAGKSIILQAIHLLSGGRAGANWIRTGAESASVEALFDLGVASQTLRDKLAEADLDSGDELILRRVVSQNGKSRYYVNNSLVTAKIVGDLAENLISVASQHDHQLLLNQKYHLDFIDAVGDHWPARQQVAVLYQGWREKLAEYQELQQQEKDKVQRRDFLTFQCREISEAKLVPGEDEELAQTKEKLKASGDLQRLGREAYELLAVRGADALGQARKNLERMSGFDAGLNPLFEQVAGVSYQLEDSVIELRNYLETIPTDPGQLEQVTARIDQLQKLKRKYGETLDEVIGFGERAASELENLEALDQHLEELARQLNEQEEKLLAASRELSKARQATATGLAKRIKAELQSLQFEQPDFEVRFTEGEPGLGSINRNGGDRPEFLFSANPGEPLKPLAAVASGGELSRLMLALKCILAGKDMVETVVFDEIDAGISGKTAEAVARKIKELAGHHQVLCITHLPQIASFASDHYLVEKSVADQRTRTSIALLSKDDQVAELARMLDGDSVSANTMAYARELLARNQ